MACTACGSVPGPNDQFCSKCGTKLGETNQQFSEIIESGPGSEVVAQCDQCGSGIAEGQLFCTACGSPVGTGIAVDEGD